MILQPIGYIQSNGINVNDELRRISL